MTEGQGVFERQGRKQSRGVHGHVFLRNFTAEGGKGALTRSNTVIKVLRIK